MNNLANELLDQAISEAFESCLLYIRFIQCYTVSDPVQLVLALTDRALHVQHIQGPARQPPLGCGSCIILANNAQLYSFIRKALICNCFSNLPSSTYEKPL